MFEALGRWTYRGRWGVLAAAAVVAIFCGVWGTGVFDTLSGAGFQDPASESSRAKVVLDRSFGRDDADLIVLYTSDRVTVDDEGFRQAVIGTLDALPSDVVVGSQTFWSTGSPALVSKDRRSTYAVLQLSGADDDARSSQYEGIADRLDAPGLAERVGGQAAVNHAINDRVATDIALAEGLSMPVVFVLLVFILGGLAAASLPLAVGGLAILGSFTAIRVITLFTDVSVFAINIVTLLGLGLAVDYGLFMVSRYREELRKGYDVPEALTRTMTSAGRTVAVSGITVAIALSGLMIFPQLLLRSMGFGGVTAVLVAMVGALTVMPALMAVLGRRVEALSVRPFMGRLARVSAPIRPHRGRHRHGTWYRIAHSVMRRPVVYVLAIVVLLVALGAPFSRVSFGGIDERALPQGTESRVVAETLTRDFEGTATPPAEMAIVFPTTMSPDAQRAAASDYATRVSEVSGVESTQLAGIADNTARVVAFYPGDPLAVESQQIVERIRQLPAPSQAHVFVGGPTAELADLLSSLASRLPLMALILIGTTLVLLFLAFGSIVLPVKAVVMNVLSLGATFGALVLIFQDGHLSSFLNFTSTGTIEATQPVLMLAIAFGLSMDYEVFLLSRVREQYDQTHDNAEAVATGLQRTGGIITSAALLLVIVIGAFSTSGITFIKLIGVGMIIAIIVDATLVRALLVPATMRLMGDLNWYAPGPLRRFYARFGVREGGDGPTAAAASPRSATRRQSGRHRATADAPPPVTALNRVSS